MKRLIRFEWKKHFLSIPILIILMIFTFVDFAKIKIQFDREGVFSNNLGGDVKEYFGPLYDQYGGAITEKKLEEFLLLYNKIQAKLADRTASNSYDPDTITGNIYKDDLIVSRAMEKPLEYTYHYKNYANQVVKRAVENAKLYESVGNIYEMHKNIYLANLFYGRELKLFPYSELFQYYLGYDFSSFLALLLCLYGLANVFIMEKETDMDSLLVTTRFGGMKTMRAKILASVLYITCISLYFSMVDFLSYLVLYGQKNTFSCPVYVVETFCNSPLNIKVWQYILLSAIIKWAGMVVIGMFFLLLSGLFRNSLFPVITGFACLLGAVVMEEKFSSSGYAILKIVNPFELVANHDLFQTTQFVNVAGHAVLTPIMTLFAGAGWFVFFLFIIHMTAPKGAFYRKRRQKHAVVSV